MRGRMGWQLAMTAGLAALAWGIGQAKAAEGAKTAEAQPAAVAKKLPPPPVQTLCPFTGEKVDGTLAVELDGFRILVADKDGAAAALKDPAGAFKKLAEKKQVAVPVSAVCPIMGNRVNTALFVDRDGRRVYVCCKGCINRVKRNFDAALAQLKKQAEEGDPEDIPEM